MKWRVLREFRVLPSERRAREMTDGDYLFCLVQLMLDEEEELARLCPVCREEALEGRCPVCGAPPESSEVVVNAAFDWETYEKRKEGATE